jgi:enoyl-CoA hydratase/carnithine racemase
MEQMIIEQGAGPVRTLILNRPSKLNCINWAMMHELAECLNRLEADAELRLVFVTGAGERAFSSGGDLKEYRELDEAETARWIRLGQQIFNRIEALPALTAALLHGYVLGGGLELALACDLRIATPETTLSSPEMLHGWPPGWGALARLPKLIGESRAKQLILLGERIQAPEALRIGLVNWVVERENLGDFTGQLAEKVSQIDPRLLAFTKAAIRAGTNVDIDLTATLLTRGR